MASYENSKQCFEDIVQNCQVEHQNVAFVGNKIDLERVVPFQ
jgi:3-deoxy-D-manno-octulosonate 8-phosphate phosphatase KdsC-like HAD superfamily phosphatase